MLSEELATTKVHLSEIEQSTSSIELQRKGEKTSLLSQIEKIRTENDNLKSVIKEHINGCCELYGEVSGIHFMRKFIMKYLTGYRMENKIELMKCENKEDLFRILDNIIN